MFCGLASIKDKLNSQSGYSRKDQCFAKEMRIELYVHYQVAVADIEMSAINF